MRTLRRGTALLAVMLMAVSACSTGEAVDTTTTAAAPPTTQVATTTSTTLAPATTATTPAPTSTLSYAVLEVTLDGDDEARQAVSEMYAWIGDPTIPTPDIPAGLAEHLADAADPESQVIAATMNWAAVGPGRVGVVFADDDVVLLADDGAGWQVVGAWLPRFGLEPWFGNPQRYVLVIGTDARPGQDQVNFRADSIHLLASNISERSGGILGFPRDTYVDAPYGADKYTHVNVYSGQQAMVDVASELSGQPVEGHIVTGFTGFQQLVNDFGGVWVDVPFGMADWRAQAYMSAGYQLLWGDKALGFSRNRNITGGDFKRSFHQGVVIAAGLQGVLDREMGALPSLIAILHQYAWTDLPLGDLVTLAAGAFLLDPALVGNQVLPGSVTFRGGASVVVLSPGAEDLFRDLDDGSLTPSD